MAFASFDRKSSSQPMAEINMVPLIDVVLVLLVIFIVTAPLLTNAVKLDLPKASSTADIQKPEKIEFAIDAAGAIDDPRAQIAIAWLLSRQDSHGRWAGRSPYVDRTASKVNASKWATLHALTVLKHAFPENGA